jgi:hypothetical protein
LDPSSSFIWTPVSGRRRREGREAREEWWTRREEAEEVERCR